MIIAPIAEIKRTVLRVGLFACSLLKKYTQIAIIARPPLINAKTGFRPPGVAPDAGPKSISATRIYASS